MALYEFGEFPVHIIARRAVLRERGAGTSQRRGNYQRFQSKPAFHDPSELKWRMPLREFSWSLWQAFSIAGLPTRQSLIQVAPLGALVRVQPR
jgi:hypothetical protein